MFDRQQKQQNGERKGMGVRFPLLPLQLGDMSRVN